MYPEAAGGQPVEPGGQARAVEGGRIPIDTAHINARLNGLLLSSVAVAPMAQAAAGVATAPAIVPNSPPIIPPGPVAPAQLEALAFVNPIYEGADPWVVKKGPFYYLCQSEGNEGISVYRSTRLTDKGIKRLVWKSPDKGWNARQVWAPELHEVNGKWYIYYAASDGKNANHRMGVLEAVNGDPLGPFVDRGMLYTGDSVGDRSNNRWAIDGTPLEVNGQLYLIWSGWEDGRDIQHLYIARMKDPCTIDSNRVRLCANDSYTWERVGDRRDERGLHEGPQIIKRHGRVFLVYSCSSSWEPTYKLGMLYMAEGADPMDPRSWAKHPRPCLQGDDRVYGIGHASFVPSPDGTEDWIVDHAKVSKRPGWQRAVWVQKIGWTTEGFPDFGSPTPAGKASAVPSGERGNEFAGEFTDGFDDNTDDRWVYFGFDRYEWVENGRLSLGGNPVWGLVNEYRAGEKALVRGMEWRDLSMQVRLQMVSGHKDAGVLFRVSQPALGYDAQRGYFAALSRKSGKVVLGKTDAGGYQVLASASQNIDLHTWYTLRVDAVGDRISVYVNGERRIALTDGQFKTGMAGVRVVDTHTLYDEFQIKPVD